MTLKNRINEDMKGAMRARDTQRLGAIRLLLAAIKQREVDERVALDDAAVTTVVEKQIKQRRDAIDQFRRVGRDDLVAQESAELAILQTYMPQQLSEQEVAEAVREAITETGASGPQQMGKVMAALKQRLAGRVDMKTVSVQVKAALTGGPV